MRSPRARVAASNDLNRTPQYGGAPPATARTAATACGVLLGVGVAAVAVLEVDPQVLHGLALQLGQQQRPGRRHLLGVGADDAGQGRRVGRVRVQRGAGGRAVVRDQVGVTRSAGT